MLFEAKKMHSNYLSSSIFQEMPRSTSGITDLTNVWIPQKLSLEKSQHAWNRPSPESAAPRRCLTADLAVYTIQLRNDGDLAELTSSILKSTKLSRENLAGDVKIQDDFHANFRQLDAELVPSADREGSSPSY